MVKCPRIHQGCLQRGKGFLSGQDAVGKFPDLIDKMIGAEDSKIVAARCIGQTQMHIPVFMIADGNGKHTFFAHDRTLRIREGIERRVETGRLSAGKSHADHGIFIHKTFSSDAEDRLHVNRFFSVNILTKTDAVAAEIIDDPAAGCLRKQTNSLDKKE